MNIGEFIPMEPTRGWTTLRKVINIALPINDIDTIVGCGVLTEIGGNMVN